MSGTLLQTLRPPVAPHRSASRQKRIDARSAPMHARALQPRCHSSWVATLDHATADWPALNVKGWILQLRDTLFQSGQVLGHHRFGQLCGGNAAQALDETSSAVVVEKVSLPALPGSHAGGLGATHRAADLADPLRGVRNINMRVACGARRMNSAATVNPCRSITHTRDLFGGFESSAGPLAERHAVQERSVGHAR